MSPRLLCLKVYPKRNQLIWYPIGCVDKVESNECDFSCRRRLSLKRRVSAKFKEYCRSDSAYRLRFRLEGPHQLSSFSSLAFLRNCNIFCFWNGQCWCNWRVRLGPMRVTDKRLTRFLFPVTVLTLCGFRGRNENLFEIFASALFVLASSFAWPLATPPIGELACRLCFAQ